MGGTVIGGGHIGAEHMGGAGMVHPDVMRAMLRRRVREQASARRDTVALAVLAYLDRATRPLGAVGWTLALTDGEGHIALVMADGASRHAFDTVAGDIDDWPLAHSIATGHSFWFASMRQLNSRYPALRIPARLVGRVAVIPLSVDGERLGACSIRFPNERPFAISEIEFASEVAAYAARLVALGATVADAEQQSEIHEAETVELLADLISSERRRLARDLHDGPLQDMVAVMLSASDDGRDQIIDSITMAVERMRDVIADLRGASTSPRGAAGVLRATVASSRHLLRHRIHADIADTLDAVRDPTVVRHLDFALREMISNVARHAAAQSMWIQADATADRVQILVRDDGIGLPGVIERGHGLYNLEWRAALLGGTFTIVPLDAGGVLARFTARL